MKRNTIIILLAVVILAALAFLLIKKKPGKSLTDRLSELLSGEKAETSELMQGIIKTGYQEEKTPEGKTILPGSGVVPKGGTDKDFFRALGYSYDYLTRLSKKDAKIARDYVENYLRKGRKIIPTDKNWKDVVRIAGYINLFPVPTFNPLLQIH